MLMSLGEKFNIIEIERLLNLPDIQMQTWVEYFKIKSKRAEEERERKKNEAGRK